MPSGHVYTMGKNALKLRSSKGIPIRCHSCDELLELGDRVIARYGKKYSKIYHLDCWEGLFI